MATLVVPAITWWQLLHKVENRPNIAPAPGGGTSSYRGDDDDDGSESWAGGTWPQAVRMMRDGWHDGAKQVDAVLATMPDAVALADAWNLEAAGRFPCVPAFLSGDPECMWQTTEMDGTKPRVCLVVPATYNCTVGPDEVMRYGAAVCATLRALEAAGHGVAIYSVESVRGHHGYNAMQAFIVRDFGQPLDTSVAAFAFHPSFLRRILFANAELTPEFASHGMGSGGYGSSGSVNLGDAVKCLGEFPATPIVFAGVEQMKYAGLLKAGETNKLLDAFKDQVQKGLAIA